MFRLRRSISLWFSLENLLGPSPSSSSKSIPDRRFPPRAGMAPAILTCPVAAMGATGKATDPGMSDAISGGLTAAGVAILPGRDRSAGRGRGRGRGRGPGAGQRRRGRATQRKVRAVLPALPRSQSAPRSCPRCSPRPARSPFLCAHPRSSFPGPPPGSAFVVRLGCRARGSRVRAVAPRDLGQRAAGSGTLLGSAQVPRLEASAHSLSALVGSPGIRDTSPRGAVPSRRSG